MMLPRGFVYLDEAAEGMFWDAKYAGGDNFMGRPADGYRVNRIVLSREAAEALKKAGEKAAALGFTFFVFDAYRPARAVRDFCAWAEAEGDEARKQIHYPNIDKRELIPQGYIAPRSGHSRGSAIDLTLCEKNGVCLDMGGIFDLMDPVSWHGCPSVSAEQTRNRETLRSVMLKSGFCDYDKEWWHYRLENEPYPNEYFDFEIE